METAARLAGLDETLERAMTYAGPLTGAITVPTPHEEAEAELTAHALAWPGTDAAPAWPPLRTLRVKGRSFCMFGAKGEGSDALTITVKLPLSFEMVQDLPFVRESRGWYRQHRWAIAHFGANDDIAAELATLKAWLKQGYQAAAPRRLARQTAEGRTGEDGGDTIPIRSSIDPL